MTVGYLVCGGTADVLASLARSAYPPHTKYPPVNRQNLVIFDHNSGGWVV